LKDSLRELKQIVEVLQKLFDVDARTNHQIILISLAELDGYYLVFGSAATITDFTTY
jgi:hypothetical protein